jgi:peptide/histidine transporter 3/4
MKQEEMDLSYLVSDDRVDRHGRIADKRTTGGWKAAPYIISMKLDRIITMY